MVPAPQRATGSSATIANSAAPTVVALSSLAQRCGAAARKDQRNLAALIMLAALTRARRRRFQRALTPTDPHTGRLGCAAAAGRRRQFFFAELVLADSALDAGARATGADADGGFAGSGRRRWCRRRSELPGHRQRSQIPQHRQWWRSPRSLSGRSSGSERSAEFGSVDHASPSRAREAAPIQRALTPTDLHRPARRRCGCWPTSTVLFRGIGVGRFELDAGARATGADADGGFAGSGRRRWCRRRATGSSATIGAAARKDQRNLAALIMLAALTRARGGADSSAL